VTQDSQDELCDTDLVIHQRNECPRRSETSSRQTACRIQTLW